MLDFGWMELLIIMAVAILVIGPDEIPSLMLNLGRFARRIQYVRFAISQQFDDMMRSADMQDIGRGVNFEAPDQDAEFDEAEHDEDMAEYLPALEASDTIKHQVAPTLEDRALSESEISEAKPQREGE